MKLLTSSEELSFLDQLRPDPIVLVPTMGALHSGHLELVKEAEKYGKVVVSIFVNPTQFAPNEDFDSYPRTLESDLDLLSGFDVAAVFSPPVSEMYADGVVTTVQPGGRADCLCGADRPGHYSGVLTVVAKLFNMTKADYAVFGRKDAQQCLVIDQMVSDLKMPIKLIDIPTVREVGGLAMSSRNRYLDKEQHTRAQVVFSSLQKAKSMLESGCRSAKEIEEAVVSELAVCDSIEYAEVLSVPELEKNEIIEGRCLLAVAVKVGSARLIDNISLLVENDKVTEIPLLGV
ncbi:MAG: pantoate--beta-alanine ligase [bacterium]|nr:pantoate--beta-alanine ligase [bacterium]MCP4799782.1 pantoate--beta-alanine ligase [bacterium]